MRLLYITNGINGSGGLERVLSVKASLLAENYGYDVHILSLNGADQNPFYDFSPQIKMNSIDVGGNPLSYIKAYKNGIQELVNQIQPEVISVCDDGLKGFFVPRWIKTEAKIIYERHVSKLIEARAKQHLIKRILTKGKWQLMEHLAKKFSKFIVLTEGNKKEWTSLRNMKVIANPLSFYPEESASLEKKRVICVGKIAFQKGQDLLMQAWKKVIQKYPDWELVLYGKEDKDFLDTDLYKNINVHFYPPVQDIEKEYLNSSIYVMSSRFEGFGMVLIESMACGLPCVSFDCDYGPGDIIQEGEDGYLVATGDVNTLSERIITLIEDENLRVKMGARAKENVKRYEAKEIVKIWNELFRSL